MTVGRATAIAATCHSASPSLASRLGPSGECQAQGKPYRPHDRIRAVKLITLYLAGKSHPQIATIYGGTPHGVRANLRRLRERGVIA